MKKCREFVSYPFKVSERSFLSIVFLRHVLKTQSDQHLSNVLINISACIADYIYKSYKYFVVVTSIVEFIHSFTNMINQAFLTS